MNTFNYLFAGYAVIFVLIGGYVLKLGSKLSELEKKINLNKED